jgi:hypothetical protein
MKAAKKTKPIGAKQSQTPAFGAKFEALSSKSQTDRRDKGKVKRKNDRQIDKSPASNSAGTISILHLGLAFFYLVVFILTLWHAKLNHCIQAAAN